MHAHRASSEIAYTARLPTVPDHERGAVFAASTAGETGGFGVGVVITSVLLPLLGVLPTVALLHGTAIVGALSRLAFVRRRACA